MSAGLGQVMAGVGLGSPTAKSPKPLVINVAATNVCVASVLVLVRAGDVNSVQLGLRNRFTMKLVALAPASKSPAMNSPLALYPPAVAKDPGPVPVTDQ